MDPRGRKETASSSAALITDVLSRERYFVDTRGENLQGLETTHAGHENTVRSQRSHSNEDLHALQSPLLGRLRLVHPVSLLPPSTKVSLSEKRDRTDAAIGSSVLGHRAKTRRGR